MSKDNFPKFNAVERDLEVLFLCTLYVYSTFSYLTTSASSRPWLSQGQVPHLPYVPSPNGQGPQFPNCHFSAKIAKLNIKKKILICNNPVHRL